MPPWPRTRTEWSLAAGGAAVAARAACACGVRAEILVPVAAIPEFPADGAADPPVRAALVRRLVDALTARGCAHAALDPALLAACLMRPDRARLRDAFALAAGLTDAQASQVLAEPARRVRWADAGGALSVAWTGGEARAELSPAEAWELFATHDLVPFAWVGDTSRVYELDDGAGATAGHPPDLRACVTLAADGAGVAQAEELAREVAAQLAPWGVAEPRAVRWRVLGDAGWRFAPARAPGLAPDDLRRAVLSEREDPTAASPTGPAETEDQGRRRRRGARAAGARRATWWELAALDALCGQRWRARRDVGSVTLSDSEFEGLSEVPRELRDAPGPFEPLVAIARLGYWLERVDGGEIVLVAPGS